MKHPFSQPIPCYIRLKGNGGTCFRSQFTTNETFQSKAVSKPTNPAITTRAWGKKQKHGKHKHQKPLQSHIKQSKQPMKYPTIHRPYTAQKNKNKHQQSPTPKPTNIKPHQINTKKKKQGGWHVPSGCWWKSRKTAPSAMAHWDNSRPNAPAKRETTWLEVFIVEVFWGVKSDVFALFEVFWRFCGL